MRPRRERVRSFLSGLVKFVALVAVAGGCGVGIGYGLSSASDDQVLAGTLATDDTQTETTAATTARPPSTTTTPPPAATATTPRTTTATATATPTATATATATTTTPAAPPKPAGALAQVKIRVLGAILRPAGTPDGQRRRRARLTMRVQATNEADVAVTIGRPVVAIGTVRVGTDTAAETADPQLGTLAAGETKAATMRFELAGDATDKVTIDRRARINIAGRSLPFRLTIGEPVKPPASTAANSATQTTPATATAP